ncbi:type I-E CRISPR-associated protein Cse2/CasB [Salmonella enterica subsp. enterica serovar Derby]|uniref:Type I-E CRISPR-associated protein Cse2/CasB n=2 Tax=Salmonella enterica TaxID=28901 RepID=A0A5U7F2W9_SALER|nr:MULTISPECIES: type I-E CRISPR-associated protein Cse2/CasB [Salmonella]EAY2766717.1 type I-E CRISPR-associated protein Cse2/CasB [Salmonella enterica subsp. enterica serovar Typhimurium]EBE3859444.1 type I-E CRISPR-associated protein Cse2/CasB [Salmonella enterica subsp. enterica serovar Agona]EBP4035194.1 type I-E CRISPR-associated protein Cse2/CasB [Salmonella enterica subsp. salamae]EBW8714457.1 type I-E CRISPR-associated protein Cse2/CasB [Salmonella enterica subsp. enterica serovar Oran
MSIMQEDHKATLRKWHEDLQEKRGARASLRRSKTVNEACLSEGFRSLLMQTHTLWKIDGQEWRVTALALTAALAANVKAIDKQQKFAAQLNGVMSELRFTRLCAVKTPDELLRQLRRAVKLSNGAVNLFSLADDIFCWCQEQNDLLNHHRRQQRPTEFLRIRWALEYYQAGDGDTDNEQD